MGRVHGRKAIDKKVEKQSNSIVSDLSYLQRVQQRRRRIVVLVDENTAREHKGGQADHWSK